MAASAPLWVKGAEAKPVTVKSHADLVTIGNTGVKVSFLAQGTGYNGGARMSDHTRMGKEAFDRLLRYDLDHGISFIDTADLYGTHTYIRDTIRGLPRDKYALLTKIWPRTEYWNMASGGAVQEVNRYRKELGTDYLDVCLIHCLLNDKWVQEYARIRDELSELKQKKVVRAVGVSCHHFGALKIAANDPWVDVIFARINHKGRVMDASVDEVAPVLKQARANGKFVVGMKIFGAGELTKPEDKDASLQYVIKNALVDAMTIGMRKIEETEDSIARLNAALRS
ncbi:aldo/keto reductase [Fontisphaera persica]|uniref:aldo/keto reductase n=1 Tax=Fontisphaera persica TaxID=2974023 RepID=UPI0024BF3F04|nr:aldo/keto reductase [Fontisphaera persica]WCJ59718.1 aldo/keto reductase [Fontisphaera persica]